MKIFICILFLAFNVSASSYSQTVSLETSKAPLREVLQQVRKQTGYYFIFQSALLNDAKPVTVNLKNAELKAALEMIFKEQPFQYEFKDKGILVKRKSNTEKNILQKVSDFFSVITVRGKVTDESGTPLPGASVKAGSKATVTDSYGEFVLIGVDEGTNVEVSYLGYKSATIVASTEFMNVQLRLNVGELKETVIKGYYTTSKELNTGNVTKVKGEVLAKNPVADPIIALQGQVPGMFISQNSGVSGSSVNVKIRGQNSLRGDALSPLYVVDGVPFPTTNLAFGQAGAVASISPFSTISIANIESIEVLKDADATAIYGSRGANGVVLITTKKGTAGAAQIDVDVNQGIGMVNNKLNLMNTPQYLEMRRKALSNDGVASPGPNDNDLNGKWGDVNQYTDWQDVTIGGTSNITTAQASISGGNFSTQYRFGGAYRRETTVFPGAYSDQKASAFMNINHKSDDQKFTASMSASYLRDNNRLPTVDFTQYILLSPNTPLLYKADGTLNWQNSTWENPLWQTSQYARTVSGNLNSTLELNYKIINGLSLNSRFGYSDLRSDNNLIRSYENFNPDVTIAPTQRRNSFATSGTRTWIAEPSLHFNRQFGKGKLQTLIGLTFQQTDANLLSQIASGFSSPGLVTNLAAASAISINSHQVSRYKYGATYVRLGYTYNDQYILNLTGRRDASSRFGPGKQFGNFGAVGAAWIFSKHSLISENLGFLSFGKLRGSFGVTGNDQIQDYKFLSTYSSSGSSYQDIVGLNPTSLTNANYGWETVKKLEAAVELGFLKDRILINASWYRNRTTNQLVNYSLPDITGFTGVQANLPALIQNTGKEFDLTTTNIENKSFTWKTSANLSIPRNKLVEYPNFASSGYTLQYAIGEPLTVQYLWHYKGIDPTTNIFTFEDYDKNNALTNADRKPVFVGPKFYGGLGNNFSYKNFSLDVFFQFVKQNARSFLSTRAPGILNEQPNQLADLVSKDDGTGNYQKFTQSLANPASVPYLRYVLSDGGYSDASFVRLKNVQFSWKLPEIYSNKMHIKNARMYLQGQNLLTFTKFKGLDPEVPTDQLPLPLLRMFVLGIQMSL